MANSSPVNQQVFNLQTTSGSVASVTVLDQLSESNVGSYKLLYKVRFEKTSGIKVYDLSLETNTEVAYEINV